MSSRRRRSMVWYLVILVSSASLFTACSGISVSGGLLGSILSLLTVIFLALTFTTTQTGCPPVGPCLSIAPPKDGGEGGSRDADVGPCLSPPPPDRGEPDVGPCLQPLPPDRQPDRGTPDVGPCLSPPLPDRQPDRGEPDVGPCLSQPPPDYKPDGGSPDGGNIDRKSPDGPIGPCLTPLPPDVAPEKGTKDTTIQPCLSQPPPDKRGDLRGPKKQHQDPTMQPPTLEQGVRYASANPRSQERQSAIEKLQQRGVLPADVAERLARNKNKKA